MNGDQMTAAIKQVSPGTPVVMVTGFADMPMDGIDVARRPDMILRKPITQMALRQAVARVLTPTFKAGQLSQVPTGAV